jgi:hypothetical protein
MKPELQLHSYAFETIPKKANLDDNCLRMNRHQGKSIDFWQLCGQHQADLSRRCLEAILRMLEKHSVKQQSKLGRNGKTVLEKLQTSKHG